MDPYLEFMATWGSGGIGLGAGIWLTKLFGQGVSWMVNTFFGRFDKREADLDAGMKELVDGLLAQLREVKAEATESRERSVAAEEAHRDCERRLTAVEGRATQLEATLQGLGDARNMLQVDLAADSLTAKAAAKLGKNPK